MTLEEYKKTLMAEEGFKKAYEELEDEYENIKNDLQVDVTISKDDTIGCENFEEMTCMKIVEGRRCYNCAHYTYDENNDWHDMCDHSKDGSVAECDPYEAESCRGYEDKS